MNGRAWTEEELRELREMYAAGVPCREMAARLGRSLKAIHARCILAGVNQGAGSRKRKWTEAEREAVRRMFAAGRRDRGGVAPPPSLSTPFTRLFQSCHDL